MLRLIGRHFEFHRNIPNTISSGYNKAMSVKSGGVKSQPKQIN